MNAISPLLNFAANSGGIGIAAKAATIAGQMLPDADRLSNAAKAGLNAGFSAALEHLENQSHAPAVNNLANPPENAAGDALGKGILAGISALRNDAERIDAGHGQSNNLPCGCQSAAQLQIEAHPAPLSPPPPHTASSQRAADLLQQTYAQLGTRPH